MKRVARETNVSTIVNTTFRDKMSWREYGFTQCGLIYSSGLPHPEAATWKRTAYEMMPDDDICSAVEIEITSTGPDEAELIIFNKTNQPIRGNILTEVRDLNGRTQPIAAGSSNPPHPFTDVPPGGRQSVSISKIPWTGEKNGIRHLLAEFVPDEPCGDRSGRCIGWTTLESPRFPTLSTNITFPVESVRYPAGVASVEDFLRANRDRLAILIEPFAALETELAVRLQSIIMEAWGVKSQTASLHFDATDVIRDNALIVLGVLGQNSFMRGIECLLTPEFLPADGPGAVVSAHPGLFQRPPVRSDWPVSATLCSIGNITYSPGAVLVIGTSFESLRDGVHDLIQRILAPGPAAQIYSATIHREAYAGIVLVAARRFAIELPAGDFAVRIAVGTKLSRREFHTQVRLSSAQFDQTVRTRDGMEWLRMNWTHPGGRTEIQFAPSRGNKACPAAVVITNRKTSARTFKCYFYHAPRVDMDFEGYVQIDAETRFGGPREETDWTDVRSKDSEWTSHALKYGWI